MTHRAHSLSASAGKRALERFIREREVRWPQHFDGKGWRNEISFRFGINAVPTLWIFDKKGNLRFTNHPSDEHALSAVFEALSAEP